MPMKQQTLAMAADQGSGYEQYRKPKRRDEFLKAWETIVPWSTLCAAIEPHYPKAGNGRPPIGLERNGRIADRPDAILSHPERGTNALVAVKQDIRCGVRECQRWWGFDRGGKVKTGAAPSRVKSSVT